MPGDIYIIGIASYGVVRYNVLYGCDILNSGKEVSDAGI